MTNHEQAIEPKRLRLRYVLLATGLMLALTVGLTALSHGEAMTFERTLVMIGIGVAGIFGLAIVLAPIGAYPRAAWIATAAGMSLVLLGSLAIAGDPGVWHEQVGVAIWVLPWLLFAMGSASSSVACSARTRTRAGWILFGSGLLSSSLVAWLPLFMDRLGF